MTLILLLETCFWILVSVFALVVVSLCGGFLWIIVVRCGGILDEPEPEGWDSEEVEVQRGRWLVQWQLRMRLQRALEQLPSPTKYSGGGGGEGASVYSGCPICLKEFEEGEMCQVVPECNHVFHCPCIHEWLMLKQICPVCRRALLS